MRRDDGSEELLTTAEVSEKEDDTKVLTTTTEASIEEVENKMRLSERLRRQRLQFFYGQRVLTTTTVTFSE